MLNTCNGLENYGDIIYYSHIIPIIISLTIVVLIHRRTEFSNLSILFSLFLLSFSLWLAFDLVTWISTDYYMIILFWSFLDLICTFFSACILLFTSCLINENNFIKNTEKYLLLLLLIPPYVITALGISVIDFDINNCEVINMPFLTYYKTLVGLIVILYVIFILVKKVKNKKESLPPSIIFICIILIVFLMTFLSTDFISSITGIYEVNLYSLLLLPLFLLGLIMASTHLNIFKTRISIIEILGYSLVFITVFQILFLESGTRFTLKIISITTSISFGLILIKSSNRDRNQLETISSLASSLESLNNSLSDKVAEQTAEIKKSYEYELKARRDLEKLSETKDKFVSIAQHNLRIPTTNIKNKIDLTIEKTTDPELKELLLQTKTSTDHLIDIADDFKSIAKLKLGSQILNLSVTSIYPILNTVLLELKLDAENMNITITFPTNPESWPELNIDANKIREVLIVILENAIRYNFKNGNIKITTKTESDKFDMIIENTGIGISEDESENLQNRQFYRSDKSKELNPTGMGIGLSLSKGIIEAHHGNLSITSKGVGMGAIVTLTLPINFLKRDYSI